MGKEDKRRHFTREFKRNAVQLVTEKGMPVGKVARELELVHGEKYRSRLEARLSIFEYVEVLYNRQRRHSALGYRSPEQYELLDET